VQLAVAVVGVVRRAERRPADDALGGFRDHARLAVLEARGQPLAPAGAVDRQRIELCGRKDVTVGDLPAADADALERVGVVGCGRPKAHHRRVSGIICP
jgi:hypothetical protein